MSDERETITTEERAMLRAVFCEKPVVLRALDALDAAERRASAADGDRDAMAREIGVLQDLLEERARALAAADKRAEEAERERDAAREAASKEHVRVGLVMGALAKIEHPNVRAAVMKAIGEVRGV